MNNCYCRRCAIHDDPGGCLVMEAELARKLRLTVPAVHVLNGDLVEYVGTVAEAHYSGPADGTGTTTLVLMDGRNVALPAQQLVAVYR